MAKMERARTPEELAQGARIRARRIQLQKAAGEDDNIEAFADDHDIPRTHLSMWEHGMGITAANMAKLAKALKMKQSDIGPIYKPKGRPADWKRKKEQARQWSEAVGSPTQRSADDTLVTAVVGSSPTSGGLPAPIRGVIDMDHYPQPELLGPFLAMWCEMGEQGRLACFHTAVAQVAPSSPRPLAKAGKL